MAIEISEIWILVEKGFLAIIEAVIYILISKIPGCGRRYSAAAAGWVGFILTTSRLISLGYIPFQFTYQIIIVGLLCLFIIIGAATNFRFRVGRGRDVWKNIATFGTYLALICPIIYAII